jgi:transposase-like protein
MTAKEQPTAKSSRAWSSREKFRLVAASEGLEGEQLSELLRREGAHGAQLAEWRRAIESALSDTGERRLSSAEAKATQKRVKELERELRRKEKALAEGAAMLFLEKKLQAMGWDDRHADVEPDETSER